MHKKRLRKKLGKRYKARAVKWLRIRAAVCTNALATAHQCNLQQVQATTSISKLSKSLHIATMQTNFTESAAKIWKQVTNAKKLPVDWYYRKKMGYPPLEEV